MKRWILTVAIIVAIVYICLLFVFNPAECRFFPKCLVYWLTGLKCAGCGGQRALYCLLHGEIVQALRYNCFLTVFVPIFSIGLYKGAT